MKTLLVTGASGLLGWNVCRLSKSEWSVYGTVFSHPVTIPGVNTIRVDLTHFSELKELFHRTRPDLVIHTAATSSPNLCEVSPSTTHSINVTASINIAGLCADFSIPCIFTSSDLVFDGLKPPYVEQDPPSPLNVYGRQKVLAESGMIERCPMVTICRMPLMFGEPGPASASFIQPMIKALKQGSELKLFVDEFRTPISAETAARGMLAIHSNAQGQTVHFGGLERLSRYDFGILLAGSLGLDNAKVIPCRQKDVVMPAPRPKDVSLANARAIGLGFQPQPLKKELETLLKSHMLNPTT